MAKKIEKYYTYYRRFLKNILRCIVEWDGFPDSFNESAFNEQVLFGGFTSAFYYEGLPVHSTGSISGIDMYNHPVWYVSANPRIQPQQRRRIGEGCIICYNTPNEEFPESFNPLVDIFAWRLADIALSKEVSIRNSRASYVPIVRDTNEAIRWNRLMEEVYDGESTAIGFRINPNQTPAQMFVPLNAKENLIVDELSDATRSTLADFFSAIGVKTVAVDKKERVNEMEMQSNDQQLKITSDIIMKPRRKFCEQWNNRFDGNISVKFNEEEVKKYVNLSTDITSRAEA